MTAALIVSAIILGTLLAITLCRANGRDHDHDDEA